MIRQRCGFITSVALMVVVAFANISLLHAASSELISEQEQWKKQKADINELIEGVGAHPDAIRYFAYGKYYTPLSGAVAQADVSYITYLLKHKANPLTEVPAYAHATEGIKNTRSLLFEACNVRIAQLLINSKADVNVRDVRPYKQPLLSYVAQDPCFEEGIIDLLVACGADVTAVDAQDWTPLHHIAAYYSVYKGKDRERQLAKVRKLVEAGVPLAIPARDKVYCGLSCAEMIAAQQQRHEDPFLVQMLPLVDCGKEFKPEEIKKIAAEVQRRMYDHAREESLTPVCRAVLPEGVARLVVDIAEDPATDSKNAGAAIHAQKAGTKRDRRAGITKESEKLLLEKAITSGLTRPKKPVVAPAPSEMQVAGRVEHKEQFRVSAFKPFVPSASLPPRAPIGPKVSHHAAPPMQWVSYNPFMHAFADVHTQLKFLPCQVPARV